LNASIDRVWEDDLLDRGDEALFPIKFLAAKLTAFGCEADVG
jgi:hypothetical protein